jgi:hypothetical protein
MHMSDFQKMERKYSGNEEMMVYWSWNIFLPYSWKVRCDDLRRTKKGRPCGASITLKTPPLLSQEPVMDAIRTFTIFQVG